MYVKILVLVILCYVLPQTLFSTDSLTLKIIAQSEQYTDADEYQKAINLLQKQLSTLPKIQAISIAAIQHKLGVNYYYTNELDEAIVAVSQAIELRSEALGESHPDTQNSLFLRLVIYRDFGKLEEALHDLERNIEYIQTSTAFTKKERDSILINRYDELGNIYLELEDHHNAIFYWEEVRNDRLAQFGENDLSVYQIEDQLAAAYKEIGQYEKAITYFEKAIQYYDQSSPPLYGELCVAYNNLALTYDLMEKPQTAVAYYQKAVRSCQKADDEKNLLEAYTNQIENYTKTGAYDLGERAFQYGIRLSKEMSETDFKADLYSNIGQLESAKGNYKLALAHLETAIQILVPDFNTTAAHPNPDPAIHNIQAKYELLTPLARKAQILTQQGKYLAALETYESIDVLITAIRAGYQVGKSKFLLLQRTAQLYEKAIAVALELYETNQEETYLEKAYQFNAKNKAIVLLEALQDESAKDFVGISSAVLKEEMDWKKKIHQSETALYEAQTDDKKAIESYRNQLFELKQNYKKFVQRLEAEYPNYYDLKYAFSKVPTIAQLQSNLPAETTLIEYFLGDQQSYIFVLQKEEFEVIPFDNPSDFMDRLYEFRSLLSSPATDAKQKKRYLELAYQNYLILLEPALLMPFTKRLLIIPDGILSQIAFESLLDESSNELSANTPFLLQKYAISYLYSSNFLVTRMRNDDEVAAECFGGFGIEYDDFTLKSVQDKGIVRSSTTNLVRSMGQLTYSDDEVSAIAKLLRGKSWLNKAATKAVFLENASRFRILHLAMHGALNEQQPLQSALIFTKTNDTTDYLLRAGELYNLRIHADLVVLSACNTGAGKINKGEGVRSLARAFQYAGSSSLIASLWSAPDQTTKEIAVRFYEYLKAGLPKDIALQQARLDYLQDSNTSPEYAHPSYWSHLVAIGDMEALEIENGGNWKWWVLGIGILFFGFFLSKT